MSDEGDDSVQDAADAVIEELEQTFGERWGGAWLKWEAQEICIGLVAPTADDAELVARKAAAAEWAGATVSVRYSAVHLDEFHQLLRPIMETADSIIALGVAPELNKVRVDLNEFDFPTTARLYAAVPPDALVISIQPGTGYAPITELPFVPPG